MTVKHRYHPDTLCLHAGQEPDPGDRRARRPHLPDDVLRLPGHRSGRPALRAQGRGPHLLPDLQSDGRRRRDSGSPPSRAASAACSSLPAWPPSSSSFRSWPGRATTSSRARRSTEGPTPSSTCPSPASASPRRFFDPPEAGARPPGLIDDRTKALYVETIGNPAGDVADLEAFARIAHDHGLPLVVDNTFAAYLCRPFEWGADVVFHSATKFIGGHGTSIGGIIVDGGSFPWDSGRFPEFTASVPRLSRPQLPGRPSRKPPSSSSAAWTGSGPSGPAASPFNAFLFLQGLETLHLRMPRHSENAERVARHLASHPKVAWVSYAGLPGHPSHDLARKYLKGGFGIHLHVRGQGRHRGRPEGHRGRPS